MQYDGAGGAGPGLTSAVPGEGEVSACAIFIGVGTLALSACATARMHTAG